jgi:hypothetical protein
MALLMIGQGCTQQGGPLDLSGLAFPLAGSAVTPRSGPTTGGTKISITGSNFRENSAVLFGGFLGENTQWVSDQILTSVSPPQAAGLVDISIVTPNLDTVKLPLAFEYVEELIDDGKPPRVVGATSIDNNTLLVTFSKFMDRPSAEALENYRISGSDTAFLVVTHGRWDHNGDSNGEHAGEIKRASYPDGEILEPGATLLADKQSVRLRTLPQDFDLYTLHVVGAKDAFGNMLATPDGIIAPPAGIDPTRATFRGTAPTEEQIDYDTDGDAFGDWFEMKGWFVTVHNVNGTDATFHVTSDPFSADTDLDGLDDSVENQFSFDPRTNDTDADHIDDYTEFNEWYSDPANQDTDGDGLADPLEIQFFHTSPILADTDGDQWTDDDELLNRNRNPRRSDIPLPQIKVGTPGIFIKETYSYTDEHGQEQTHERSSSNSLSQGTSNTFATSDTQSSENSDKYSQELGTEFTFGGQDPFGGFTINAKVGFEQTRQRGYSSTVNQESARNSSSEFQKSVSEATSFSENRAVSRTIEEARLNLDVTISNLGDVAFTVSDLELAAFIRDPIQKIDMPLATLLSERSIAGDDEQFNLGPFDLNRGPFIFRDIQIFPNVAEQLRASPQALTIKVANFNIRDESGRLFAFSSQDINDRTAGIIIDYGNGEVEAHRVATAAKFDDFGKSKGITMREALVDILGINIVEDDNAPIANPITPTVRNSYGTVVGTDGVELLTRVRGIQTTVGGGPHDRKFWAILSSAQLPTGVNFSDTVLKAGSNYSLQFVQDRDSDGLFASTEFIYGSSDENDDTDNDGIGDFDEVRTGWIMRQPGNEHRVFSDPSVVDSDGDGMSDFLEREYGTDPRKADSDEDGITDKIEIQGYELVLFDGDDDPTNNPSLVLTPYTDYAIIDGGNGVVDTTATGDDVQAKPVGSNVDPGTPVVTPGPDGILNTTAADDDFATFGPTIVAGANLAANTPASGDDIQLVSLLSSVPTPGTPIIGAGLNGVLDTTPGGDDFVRAGHEQFFASDPLRRDTDADSLPDGRERFLGSQPNDPTDAGTVVDTDFDGMVDAEENNGWNITVNGATTHVTSDPLKADTDSDGLPDLMERFFRMNPRLRDTDGDTIADRTELDTDDPRHYFPSGTYDDFNLKCALAQACTYTPPSSPTGTNPLKSDTDADGRSDYAEINIPWSVSVFGQPTVNDIHSDPFKADADNDGLNDLAELNAGTDPNNDDTDGDKIAVGGNTANDGYELNTRGTNPLKPDEKVTVTLTNLVINGDCDGSAVGIPGIELENGGIYLTKPDGSLVTLKAEYGCSDEYAGGVESGTYETYSGVTQTFIMETGGSFTIYSGTFRDHDNLTCGTHDFDDDVGSFNNPFTYPSVTGNQAFTVTADSDCGLTVNATISVQ